MSRGETRLPKYRIMVLTDEGAWEPVVWPDSGWHRFKVGRDPEGVIRAAIAEMMECADAEPEQHFAVLGPDNEIVAESTPALSAEPVPF